MKRQNKAVRDPCGLIKTQFSVHNHHGEIISAEEKELDKQHCLALILLQLINITYQYAKV